ncbi:MAG TPA: DNA/RNA nuclease SfsA [Candidatus Binatia bacterium]|nr:DNA/RNA nuclease SfsA [Candidatus Binatia bacterium]
MRFPSRLIRGTLIQRYKRFLADVRLPNGEIVTAHCTNTGSMLGCNAPGSAVYLSLSPNKGRKLAYTWEMIQIDRTWIGINTFHPNHLVAEAIAAGGIPELCGYEVVRREVKVSAHSRLDLCLEGRSGCCYVEIKNVTMSFDGAAAFPDAVSERATKHLKELIRLKRKGHRAAIVFVIQRRDCEYFRPADEIDPEYGRWLRRASRAGVEILPYVAKVTTKGILLGDKLETQLEIPALPRAQRT